jgi:hypothetical protein
MIKALNDDGRPWVVRLVFNGDKYGLDFKLTHAEEDPLVEFYDARYEHTAYGQFVSHYYASTLLDSETLRQPGQGLNLAGGVPEWKISSKGMLRVLLWVRASLAGRGPNDTPIDRQWLSKYIGDMQTAWEQGDRDAIGHMLFDAKFNDVIYYTS